MSHVLINPCLHLRTPVSSLVFLPGDRGPCFLHRVSLSTLFSWSPFSSSPHDVLLNHHTPASSLSLFFFFLASLIFSHWLDPFSLPTVTPTSFYSHSCYPLILSSDVFLLAYPINKPSKETLTLAVCISSLLNTSDLPDGFLSRHYLTWPLKCHLDVLIVKSNDPFSIFILPSLCNTKLPCSPSSPYNPNFQTSQPHSL